MGITESENLLKRLDNMSRTFTVAYRDLENEAIVIALRNKAFGYLVSREIGQVSDCSLRFWKDGFRKPQRIDLQIVSGNDVSEETESVEFRK